MKLKQPICKKQEKIGRVAAGKTKKATEGGEYEFRLMPSTRKTYTRKHWCNSDAQAKTEAWGMMYALFFEYKHPHVEIWKNGKMMQRLS